MQFIAASSDSPSNPDAPNPLVDDLDRKIPQTTLGLFEGYGVEVEYMIVDQESLDVRPIADQFLVDDSGRPVSDIDWGVVGWSNELVLHLLELKNPEPCSSLSDLPRHYSAAVRRANQALDTLGARLMPGGAHPWMRPHLETRLWPHEGKEIYARYDRIFDCKDHGWSNLQSVHLNLPFRGDDQFARLHTAIRTILPLIPALSASSPFLEGRSSHYLDARLEAYRTNSRLVPSIAGQVVPEPIESPEQYQELILEPMYRQISSWDPEGILKYEWLNARGAIARFDRSAIEIRVIDTQECPTADAAILQLVCAVLMRLVGESRAHHRRQLSLQTERLAQILKKTTRQAEQALIEDLDYLALLGLPEKPRTAGAIWRTLFEEAGLILVDDQARAISRVLESGPLARRMLHFTSGRPSQVRLSEMAERLCACLADDELF